MAGTRAGVEHHARRQRNQVQAFEQALAHLALQHGGGIVGLAGALE
jgi:hypothetical protein